MGIIKRYLKNSWEESKAIERAHIQASITAQKIVEQQRAMTTCKICQRIFSEGYPYQKDFWGKPKNYVCMDCAKNMRLI